MAIALVTGQLAQASSSGVSSFTISLPNNPTPGNFVVAAVAFGNNSSITASSVKDTAATPNTYTATAAGTFTANAQSTGIWFLPNTPASATKSVAWTFTGSVFGDFFLGEFSGAATSSPQDVTAVTAAIASSTHYITPSITTVTNGDLIVCAAASNGDVGTVGGTGTGATGNGVNAPFTGFSNVGSTNGGGGEYLIQATAAARPLDFSLSAAGTGAGAIAAFKAAAAAPAIVPGGGLLTLGVGA